MLQEDSRPLDIHRLRCIAWFIVLRRNWPHFVRARCYVVSPERSCNILLHVHQDKAQSQPREMYGSS